MTSITYTAVLDVSRETAETLARLLRERLGTRKNTRALGVFKQGILVLRWFVDGTRLAQLARDNQISVPTAYRYLHEGLTVLADHAPDLSTALERAAAAGYTHLNLDGTVIRTDRVAAPGPNGAALWWPCAVRVEARARNDSVVHRNGETGSPRVCGSISDSSAGSRRGSVSVRRLRPAPGARTRRVGEEQPANSAIPRAMVAVLVPEAAATLTIPPQPRAVAALARYNRRRRSSRCGRI